jgi:hypothetical protein
MAGSISRLRDFCVDTKLCMVRFLTDGEAHDGALVILSTTQGRRAIHASLRRVRVRTGHGTGPAGLIFGLLRAAGKQERLGPGRGYQLKVR